MIILILWLYHSIVNGNGLKNTQKQFLKKEGAGMRIKPDIEAARLLSLPAAAAYLGIGRNNARSFCEEIGAVRRIGSRVLFDKQAIDKALDDMGSKQKSKLSRP